MATPKTIQGNPKRDGWQPESDSRAISALFFEDARHAQIVERLWPIAEANGMGANDFIHSIGFLFRMYGVTDGWGSIK